MEQRRTQLERITALEVHADEVRELQSAHIGRTADALKEIEARLSKMDLNGHSRNLKALAVAAPKLLRVAEVASTLEEIAGNTLERRAAVRFIARTTGLNTRVVRGAVNALFGAVCYALVVNGPIGVSLGNVVRSLHH